MNTLLSAILKIAIQIIYPAGLDHVKNIQDELLTDLPPDPTTTTKSTTTTTESRDTTSRSTSVATTPSTSSLSDRITAAAEETVSKGKNVIKLIAGALLFNAGGNEQVFSPKSWKEKEKKKKLAQIRPVVFEKNIKHPFNFEKWHHRAED